MTNKTYRVLLEKLGGTDATTYIGNEGELFYDPTSTTLRVADGATQGGSVVSGGGGSDSSDTLTVGTETLTLSANTLSYNGDSLQIINYTNNAITLSDYSVIVTSTGPDIDDNIISSTWNFEANGVVILPNESNFNSKGGTISVGTTDLSASFARGSFIEFYDTANTNSWFNATARDNNSHSVAIVGGADANTSLLYFQIQTYDGGMDYGQKDWTFHKSGKTQFPAISPPASSVGVSGDTTGMVAFTQDYLYYCVGVYDGASDIWKRIAWPNDTW